MGCEACLRSGAEEKERIKIGGQKLLGQGGARQPDVRAIKLGVCQKPEYNEDAVCTLHRTMAHVVDDLDRVARPSPSQNISGQNIWGNSAEKI
jgi:hypothetical protein